MPEEKQRSLRVFLSYASQDRPAVRELYQRLKTEGWIDPWLDIENLTFGQHWTTVIEDALDAADVVLIFLSKNSVQKEGFVQRELNYAWELSLEKPRNVIFLIPLRLDDCEVPRYLRSRHWGDYFGEKKESTYQTLLRSLKERYRQKLRLEAEERARAEELARKQAEEAIRLEEEEREQEAAEKVSREKVEREAAEKAAQEKAEKEAAEKAKRERAERKAVRRAASVRNYSHAVSSLKSALRKNVPVLSVLGILGIIAVLFWGGSRMFPKLTEIISIYSPTPLPSEITDDFGVEMILVPADKFSMGDDNGESDEQPIHQVYLDSYYIDKYEISNAIYKACEDVGVCDPPNSKKSNDRSNYYGNPQYDNYPVVFVSWYKANTYCEWRGARLPTEAEWEKAARGTDRRTYPWGQEIGCDRANYYDLIQNEYCVGNTTKIGNYERGVSPYGLYDMAGNVWEWVADWYSDVYYQNSPFSNPLGPDTGKYRSLRGGSWFVGGHLKVFSRNSAAPGSVDDDIGFRCARDANP